MNAEYIQEPERTLPVRYADYDVIVAGGGIAGTCRTGGRISALRRRWRRQEPENGYCCWKECLLWAALPRWGL